MMERVVARENSPKSKIGFLRQEAFSLATLRPEVIRRLPRIPHACNIPQQKKCLKALKIKDSFILLQPDAGKNGFFLYRFNFLYIQKLPATYSNRVKKVSVYKASGAFRLMPSPATSGNFLQHVKCERVICKLSAVSAGYEAECAGMSQKKTWNESVM